MNIFENLEELNVSEECFEDILNIVEEYINEVSLDKHLKAAENSQDTRILKATDKEGLKRAKHANNIVNALRDLKARVGSKDMKSTNANAFYKEVKDKIKNNQNLPKKELEHKELIKLRHAAPEKGWARTHTLGDLRKKAAEAWYDRGYGSPNQSEQERKRQNKRFDQAAVLLKGSDYESSRAKEDIQKDIQNGKDLYKGDTTTVDINKHFPDDMKVSTAKRIAGELLKHRKPRSNARYRNHLHYAKHIAELGNLKNKNEDK